MPGRKTRKGRATSLYIVSLGLLVLAGFGIVARDRIREEYYLLKLASEDENDVRLAARMLTKRTSPRGVGFIASLVARKPHLAREILPIFSKSDAKGFIAISVPLMKLDREEVTSEVYRELPVALDALGGAEKKLASGDLLKDPVVLALERLGPEGSEGLPLIRFLLKDRDPTIAWYAAHAMGEMGGAAVNILRADLHVFAFFIRPGNDPQGINNPLLF